MFYFIITDRIQNKAHHSEDKLLLVRKSFTERPISVQSAKTQREAKESNSVPKNFL